MTGANTATKWRLCPDRRKCILREPMPGLALVIEEHREAINQPTMVKEILEHSAGKQQESGLGLGSRFGQTRLGAPDNVHTRVKRGQAAHIHPSIFSPHWLVSGRVLVSGTLVLCARVAICAYMLY